MYKIEYWAHSPQVLAYFDNYQDCNKAFILLREKYPDSKIWMKKVETITCFEEFIDKTNGRIEAYEESLKTRT